MLKATIAAIFFLFTTAFAAQAQAPEPDFVNQPVFWDRSSPATTQLRRVQFSYRVGPSRIIYLVTEPHAVFRIKSSHPHAFLIKPKDDMDPVYFVALYKFQVKSSKRKAVGQKAGRQTSNDPTMATEDMVGFTLKKAGEGVYEIVPNAPLAPGEYAFMAMNSMYEFGVD